MFKKPKNLKFAIIASDSVLFTVKDGKLQTLLTRVHRPPHFTDHWGAPGGLIKPSETAEQAARRILRDKAGVRGVYLEQLHTFSRVDRDPRGRVVAVAYMALVPYLKTHIKESDEVAWFSVNKLPRLAYDHEEIIHCAILRLRDKLKYTSAVRNLLAGEFTLGELQKTYEIILGKKLDKRNFRKKFLALGLVKPLGRLLYGKTYRPAQLFKFGRNP